MNLIQYQLRQAYYSLIGRYHNGGYRSVAEFRQYLIRECGCDFVAVRETPDKRNKIYSWEIHSYGKKYFYNYDNYNKTLKCIGVR